MYPSKQHDVYKKYKRTVGEARAKYDIRGECLELLKKFSWLSGLIGVSAILD